MKSAKFIAFTAAIMAATAMFCAGCTHGGDEGVSAEVSGGTAGTPTVETPAGETAFQASAKILHLDDTSYELSESHSSPLSLRIMFSFQGTVVRSDIESKIALKKVASQGGGDVAFEIIWKDDATLIAKPKSVDYADRIDVVFGGEKLGTARVMTKYDKDGDGFADIALGAGMNKRAYLIKGSSGFANLDISTAAVPTITSTREGFGAFVEDVGDVNADGLSDFIVFDKRFAYIYFGKGDSSYGGANVKIDFVAYMEGILDKSFIHVSSASGDLNKDGYGDIAIGVSSVTGNQDGHVFVIMGRGNWESQYAVDDITSALYSGVNDAELGRSVDIGDVNGDGALDIVMGAPEDTTNGPSTGNVFIVFGPDFSMQTFDGQYQFAINEPVPFRIVTGSSYGFGSALAAGDINGDGIDDMAIGTPSESNVGATYIYLGKSDLRDQVATFQSVRKLQGSASGGKFGAFISFLGDVLGDDREDFTIVSPGYYESYMGLEFKGTFKIVEGSENVANMHEDNFMRNGIPLKTPVLPVGDLFGTGKSIFMATSPGWDEGIGQNEGRVLIYEGTTLKATILGKPGDYLSLRNLFSTTI